MDNYTIKKDNEYLEISKAIRKDIFNMIVKNGAGHYASALSSVEILVALYLGGVMNYNINYTKFAERDRFIMSKGHAATALYSVLAKAGVISDEILDTYCKSGSQLGGLVNENIEYGLECAGGSLGHGLGFAGGVALNGKILEQNYHTFVLLGDGECQEGSVWEAAMCIASYKLDNITVIIDRNRLQASDFTDNIVNMDSMEAKWKAFGWNVFEVDGHDVELLINVLNKDKCKNEYPRVIIANTVKGKGISFIENSPDWHCREMNDKEKSQAMEELGIGECK